MARLLLVVGGLAVAALVAALAGRRAAAPAANTGHVPRQLDRRDFAHPGVPWLVAVFTSATCDTCRSVRDRALPLASDEVAVVDVVWQDDRTLHDKYKVDAVPTLVIADADGIVRQSFVGPVSTTHLWAAVAEVRDPGSVPPCGPD